MARNVWPALSASARDALARAEVLRAFHGSTQVRASDLLAGLLAKRGSTIRQAFARAGISPAEARRRFAALGYDAPFAGATSWDEEVGSAAYPPARDLTAAPPMAQHVARAVAEAAGFAGWPESAAPGLGRVTHGLVTAGLFTVAECNVVRAFADVRPHLAELVGAGTNAAAGTVLHTALSVPIAPVAAAELSAPRAEAAPTLGGPPAPAFGAGTGAVNDRPEHGIDCLGIDDYAAAFADLIVSPDTQLPLTIGVFGAWGSGKTFLMERIKRLVAHRPAATPGGRVEYGVHSVHFNAWQYSAAEHIWPRMVRYVLDCVAQEEERADPWLKVRRWWSRLRRNFGRTVRVQRGELAALAIAVAVVSWVVLRLPALRRFDALQFFAGLDPDASKLTLAGLFGALVALIKAARDAIIAPLASWLTALSAQDVVYGKELDHMARIRDDLERLERDCRAARRRVLVVVDDLDRCEPAKAMEVLQAINLLFDRDCFVVCLGIDARVITAAVERHYLASLGRAGVSGYEYLDKIVQIPLRLPQPSPAELETFVGAQLQAGAPDQSSPVARIPYALRQQFRQSTQPAPGPLEAAGTTVLERLGVRKPEAAPAGPVPASWPPPPPSPVRAAAPDPAAAGTRSARAPIAALTFTDAERAAFHRLAPVLRPNPRHVKRLVNLYGLVRALAARRGDHAVLDHPEAAACWLTLLGQWPYAARAMLRSADGVASDPADPPLRWLLDRVTPTLDPAIRRRFDDDAARLDLLVAGAGALTWPVFRSLRRYTLNFNPALDVLDGAPVPPPAPKLA